MQRFPEKIGLDTIRSALGLREDINHFDIVDVNRLLIRRRQNRRNILYDYERYTYQVAIAAFTGFTIQAQEFAASHRIPLLEFNKMPFWTDFCELLGYHNVYFSEVGKRQMHLGQIHEEQVIEFASDIGRRMAVAITNSGQLLFLYRVSGNENIFSDSYTLHWHEVSSSLGIAHGKSSTLIPTSKKYYEKMVKQFHQRS